MVSSPQASDDSTEELNITVAVRCRGRNEREIKAKSSVVVSVPDVTGSNEISINTTDDVGITAQINSKTYTVDKVFGPSANQSLIFENIAEPLFFDFIKGYNCTVLVYGMTSTGKTYTMTGDEKLYNGELSDSAGIIPRILFRLFETLEHQKDDYVVKCSFVELYNEELNDLLSVSQDTAASKRLKIFDSDSVVNSNNSSSTKKYLKTVSVLGAAEPMSTTLHRKYKRSLSYPSNPSKTSHSNKAQHSLNQEQTTGIYIQNLQDFHIDNAKEGIRLLQKGLKYRQVASTKMNDFSSRSHTIFTITLYKEHEGEMFRISKMNLVDLAGSENISRSGAQHQRAKEAGSINQSLLTLGRVINSLADKNAHVPFRESKLTRLLQDSLGGNTKTALIATISPAKINSEETCSTLQYAAKAKNIKNKPQLGSIVMKDILVKNITSELAKIKSDLLSTKSREGIYMSQDNYRELTNDVESYKNEVQECKRVVETLTSQNSLLLKDKKASNEVNDLQRIKLQSMRDSISELYTKIEKQHKREQDLVGLTATLKSAMITMRTTIKLHEKREQDFKEKIRISLGEEFSRLKNMFVNNLEEINQNEYNDGSDVQDHLEIVKKETVKLIKNVQGQAEKMYKDCMKEILSETPNFHEVTAGKIAEVEYMLNEYHRNLSENLSDVSEESNNLKQYLAEHFFKNDHDDLLASHVDRTYNQIQFSADSLLQKFKEMMNSHLESNKNFMMKSLRNAASEVIEKEMQHFEPQKKKWEQSFEHINRCDSINNTFQNEMKSALSHIKSAVGSSTDSISASIAKVKDQVEDYEDASLLVNKNEIFTEHFGKVLHKDEILEQRLQRSISSTQDYVTVIDKLRGSIINTVNNECQITDEDRPTSIDDLLKKLEDQNLLTSFTGERHPLRATSLQCLTKNSRGYTTGKIKRPGSQSPSKFPIDQDKNNLKRLHSDTHEGFEENKIKEPRKNE